ncbi:MAG TPA: hypothetical protein VKU19_11445 [Bryobacteraceae bacterium]|nr:hypothetical protein [Bryobacteraceae bacterium]
MSCDGFVEVPDSEQTVDFVGIRIVFEEFIAILFRLFQKLLFVFSGNQQDFGYLRSGVPMVRLILGQEFDGSPEREHGRYQRTQLVLCHTAAIVRRAEPHVFLEGVDVFNAGFFIAPFFKELVPTFQIALLGDIGVPIARNQGQQRYGNKCGYSDKTHGSSHFRSLNTLSQITFRPL